MGTDVFIKESSVFKETKGLSDRKFKIGEKNGQKADPWLAAKKRLSEEGNDEDGEDFDDLENAAMEAQTELLTNEVARELVPQHPIIHTICVISYQGHS